MQIGLALSDENLAFGVKASMAILDSEFNSRKGFEGVIFIFSFQFSSSVLY